MTIVTSTPDGQRFDPEALPQTITYNADGTLNYIQVSGIGGTYRQTMSYTGGKITGVSGWVRQ